jgi:magnesium chelatase accessory protein
MGERLSWEREGWDWPHRAASRFPVVGGLKWHVQVMGVGPVLLLIHGTGAATHTWRDLAPLLADRFEIVAPDLPGHGFTDTPPPAQLSLDGMAEALAALLDALDREPRVVVGHSAGAAILARLCLDGKVAPRALMSLNGALLPLRGMPGHLFSPAARLLAALPLVSDLFAWRARAPGAVERLVRGTGSTLDPKGLDLYRRLIGSPGHVAAALTMMANWELEPLERDLPRLAPELFLLVGERDRTVPPSEALRVQALLPAAHRITLPCVGHLAHEERPREVADLIAGLAASVGVAAGRAAS